MAGSSSQLTGVDYSSAVSSPLVSVFGIIDAQASLLSHHLISQFFRYSSLHMSWNFFFLYSFN